MKSLPNRLSQKLFTLFIYLGKKESLVEQYRQKLAHVPDFEPRQLFEKIARDGKQMTAEDIFQFTKLHPDSQHKTDLTIEMCHLMIKFWEGNTDQGYLSL